MIHVGFLSLGNTRANCCLSVSVTNLGSFVSRRDEFSVGRAFFSIAGKWLADPRHFVLVSAYGKIFKAPRVRMLMGLPCSAHGVCLGD